MKVLLTISAMPVHWIKPTRIKKPVRIFHPDSRFCFPPAIMTTKAIRVMPSMTTAKDIRKPTERHMEQK